MGIAASSLSPVASYEIGQYFKEKGTEGSSAHILAHTVLGAAVAAAGGNDALTAGLVAGGAEAAAPALSSFLYNKKTSDLTADEKSTISAITGLVATGIGGIASGGDIATAVQSRQGAQNAVENNFLNLDDTEFLLQEVWAAKLIKESTDELYKFYAELSDSNSKELAELCSSNLEACGQKLREIRSALEFINSEKALSNYYANGLFVTALGEGVHQYPEEGGNYVDQTQVRFVEYENLSDLSKYANSELSSDIKKYLGSKDYEYSNQPFLDKPWGSMYVAPALQIVGGGLTVAGAAVIGGTLCETVIGCVVAGYLAGSGGDDIRNGGINWGQEPIAHQATLREQLLRSMGMSEGAAAWTTLGLDFGTGLGAAKLVLKPNFIPELNKYPSELSSKDMFVDNNFYRDDYQQYDLYRENNAVHWNTSEPLAGGNWAWAKEAPNDGAVAGSARVGYTQVGDSLDRFGNETGKYLAPSGVPLEKRSLPPGTYRPDSLHSYTVLKEFKTQEEIISPAFGQSGGGIQIRAVIPEVPNGYASIEQLKNMSI